MHIGTKFILGLEGENKRDIDQWIQALEFKSIYLTVQFINYLLLKLISYVYSSHVNILYVYFFGN